MEESVEAVVLGGVVVRGLGTMRVSGRAEIMPKHKFGFGLVPGSQPTGA